MDAGFEPARVHQLCLRTLDAIDALSGLDSSDPAAAESIRTVRLTRNNLEDHWMPALDAIERSDVMVHWRAGRLASFGLRAPSVPTDSLPDHLRPDGITTIAIGAERRNRLLARLDLLERRAVTGDADHRAGTDPTGAPTNTELAALGRHLAFWVTHDAAFADEVVGLSASNMLVGRLLGDVGFSSSFASDVVRQMAVPNGPDTNVDPDRYATSLSTALERLTDDPPACLDLLLDRPTAYSLASWQALDPMMLADFVVSGLHVAVSTEPDRLADGYEVLQFLTRAANGPLDGGISAGMALGVATSLAGYVETLAPQIRQEGATPVVIHAVTPAIELGTYDDLVDLFGALLRVPEAQSALGTVLAAYTFDTFERVGGDPPARPDVTHLAEFTDLVGDASRTEQAELVMAAAVDEARWRRLGGMIGFTSNVTLLAGGAGSVIRASAGQAVRAATNWTARTEPEQLTDGLIPAHTYDLITVAAVAVAASDPSRREAADLGDVTPAQWADARRQIDIIEQIDDRHERMVAIGALDHWIETSVPALARHLLQLRTTPGMAELKEGRNAVASD